MPTASTIPAVGATLIDKLFAVEVQTARAALPGARHELYIIYEVGARHNQVVPTTAQMDSKIESMDPMPCMLVRRPSVL